MIKSEKATYSLIALNEGLTQLKKISGIYADMLQDIFTATTGMATHL